MFQYTYTRIANAQEKLMIPEKRRDVFWNSSSFFKNILRKSKKNCLFTKNGVPHGLHLDFLTFCKISEMSGVFETIFRHQFTAVYGFLTYSNIILKKRITLDSFNIPVIQINRIPI